MVEEKKRSSNIKPEPPHRRQMSKRGIEPVDVLGGSLILTQSLPPESYSS